MLQALSRDATLFSPSTTQTNDEPKETAQASSLWSRWSDAGLPYHRLSPSAFWLEAARRVTENAVQPLERAVAECAPSLAPHLVAASTHAAAAVSDADSAPLALVACDATSRAVTLRLVRHIIGDPISRPGNKHPGQFSAKELAPPACSNVVVHMWGTELSDGDVNVRVTRCATGTVPVTLSPRPSLRRFSLALVFAPTGPVVLPKANTTPTTGSSCSDVRRGGARPDGLDDDDDDDASDPVVSMFALADVHFVVIDLEAVLVGNQGSKRSLPPLDSAITIAHDRYGQIAYVFVAGRLALKGLGAVLKALGIALFYLSRQQGQPAPPDFFVVGPLDAEMRRDLSACGVSSMQNGLLHDLARDERRLMRVFASLPRARAHSAIEALLARARVAQTAACALESVASATRCGPTWRNVSRWMSTSRSLARRNGHHGTKDEQIARHELADLDIPELRALAAERQLPIEACRTALRELDKRKWARAYS